MLSMIHIQIFTFNSKGISSQMSTGLDRWSIMGKILSTKFVNAPFYYISKKWYFVTKIVLTSCEKKLFKWSRKTFEIRGWRPRIDKIFEITRTICSNRERSEQFLVTECFFNLSWRFLRSNKLEQLGFKLEKIILISKHAEKVRKWFHPIVLMLAHPLRSIDRKHLL